MGISGNARWHAIIGSKEHNKKVGLRDQDNESHVTGFAANDSRRAQHYFKLGWKEGMSVSGHAVQSLRRDHEGRAKKRLESL